MHIGNSWAIPMELNPATKSYLARGLTGKKADWCRQESLDSGFSLIELVVVISILGILVSLSVPSFFGLKDHATQASAKSALVQIFKECAYLRARGAEDPAFRVPTLYAYTIYPSNGSCDGDSYGRIGARMHLTRSGASMPMIIEIDATTKAKYCFPGANEEWCWQSPDDWSWWTW